MTKGSQSWIFSGRTDAEAEISILWPPDAKNWCWERLKAGEGDDRGWNVWMASPTQRTWFWVNLLSCWWTGKPGLLQSMGSQRVRHNWATELSGCTSSVGFLNVSSIQWHPYLRSHGFLAIENLYLKDFSFQEFTNNSSTKLAEVVSHVSREQLRSCPLLFDKSHFFFFCCRDYSDSTL